MAISSRGTSLFEVMLTLVIIAILATVGYPSFHSYLLQARRGEAQNHLMALQLRQEEYRLVHGHYTADMQQLRPDPGSDYDFQLRLNDLGYVLTASARADSRQSQDTGCHLLSLDQDRQSEPTACW